MVELKLDHRCQPPVEWLMVQIEGRRFGVVARAITTPVQIEAGQVLQKINGEDAAPLDGDLEARLSALCESGPLRLVFGWSSRQTCERAVAERASRRVSIDVQPALNLMRGVVLGHKCAYERSFKPRHVSVSIDLCHFSVSIPKSTSKTSFPLFNCRVVNDDLKTMRFRFSVHVNDGLENKQLDFVTLNSSYFGDISPEKWLEALKTCCYTAHADHAAQRAAACDKWLLSRSPRHHLNLVDEPVDEVAVSPMIAKDVTQDCAQDFALDVTRLAISKRSEAATAALHVTYERASAAKDSPLTATNAVAHKRTQTACSSDTSSLSNWTTSTTDSYRAPSTYTLRRRNVHNGPPLKAEAKSRAATSTLKNLSANAHAILHTPPGANPLLPSVVAFIEAELSLSSQSPTCCAGKATSDSIFRTGFKDRSYLPR